MKKNCNQAVELYANNQGRDISDTWNSFIDNCKKCYVPNLNLTIAEQLFPCKTRCPFTQYMPNKPDKFGIKF